MERILSIEKEHFKNHYVGHLAAALLFCLLAPVIVGMEALNRYQAGQVLDMYFSLLGIVLLTPLFMPEQNKDIRDLLASKEYPVRNVQLLRLLQAGLGLALMNLFILFRMKLGECTFPFGTYFLCAMASCIFLGGLGIFAYGITDNLIAGYMIPLGYYMAALGGGYPYLKKLYPFGMLTDYETKYWILTVGILLMACGLFLYRRRR